MPDWPRAKGVRSALPIRARTTAAPYRNGVIQNGVFTATLSTMDHRLRFRCHRGRIRCKAVATPTPAVRRPRAIHRQPTFLSSDKTFFYGNGTGTDGSYRGARLYFRRSAGKSEFLPADGDEPVLRVRLQPDAALQTAIPYLPAQFGGNTPNAQVSPLLLATPANSQFGGFNPNTNPNGTAARWLQSSIAFNGAGASQSSAFTVNTGSFFTSSDTGTVAGTGPVRGSFLANGDLAAGPDRLLQRDGAGRQRQQSVRRQHDHWLRARPEQLRHQSQLSAAIGIGRAIRPAGNELCLQQSGRLGRDAACRYQDKSGDYRFFRRCHVSAHARERVRISLCSTGSHRGRDQRPRQSGVRRVFG